MTHVDEHKSDEFAMWVWSSGDEICIAVDFEKSESKVFVWSEGELLNSAQLTPRQIEDAVRTLRSRGRARHSPTRQESCATLVCDARL